MNIRTQTTKNDMLIMFIEGFVFGIIMIILWSKVAALTTGLLISFMVAISKDLYSGLSVGVGVLIAVGLVFNLVMLIKLLAFGMVAYLCYLFAKTLK